MMRRTLLLGMLALSMPVSALDLDQLKARLNELEQPAATSPSPSAKPSGLAQFTAQEQTTSLKQALTQGAETAVACLAKEGSSDFPVGNLSRIQIKPAAVEIDGDLEMVSVPESTGTFLYSSNL